ncbi:hypothetical protein [Tsuneonella suprasediminis]|uniref:hypothetical protein n=1 Tax=Tsuneonella suprasediminis TaxID=2306996 RepID=UPI0010584962|nr:hypothetical protein [Tsuneonella suprasediminis]
MSGTKYEYKNPHRFIRKNKYSFRMRRSFVINLIGLLVLYIGYLLSTSTSVIDPEYKIYFRIISATLFSVNIIIDKSISAKYTFPLLALFFMLTLNQSYIGANIVFIVMMSMSLELIGKNKSINTILIVTSILVFVHIALLMSGQIADTTTNFGNRLRSTLGFANANQASAIYLSFALLSIYAIHIKYSKAKLFFAILAVGLAVAVFLRTDSRTAMAGLIISAILMMANTSLKRYLWFRKALLLFAYITPLICIAATYYMINNSNREMNYLFSNRPYLYGNFLQNKSIWEIISGWKLLDGEDVDSGYLMLLSGIGAIGSSIILLLYLFNIRRQGNITLLMASTFLILSMFEAFLLRPEIPLSLFFAQILSRRQPASNASAQAKSPAIG